MRLHSPLVAIVLGAMAVGCGSSSTGSEDVPSGTTAGGDLAAPLTGTELLDRLMLADMADGVDDKTVTKCATCQLVMKGSDAHAVEYEGYEFHLCSPTCEQLFESDPAAAVSRLTVEPTSTTGP